MGGGRRGRPCRQNREKVLFSQKEGGVMGEGAYLRAF